MLALLSAMVVGTAVAGLQGTDEILAWVVQPRVLLIASVANVIVLAFRLYAAIDAYRAAGAGCRRAPAPSPVAAGLGAAGLALVVVLVAAPHAVAGYYAYLSHDVLTTVFNKADAAPSTTSLPPTTTTVVRSSTTTTTAVTSTESTTTTTESLGDIAGGLDAGDDGLLSLLLLGTDAGYGRRGARADVVMVATIDLTDGYVALFGIPRNTGNVPLRGEAAAVLGTDTYPDMITNLYSHSLDHPQLAPEGDDPGAAVLSEAVGTMLGIPVDYYAVVDMGGFVDLVDAFGGVDLNVKKPINVRMSPPVKGEDWRVYNIPAGRQHLDGHEALAFARSRTGNSDYDRMRRQRCVLKALLYQNGAAELAFNFPSIAGVVRDHVKTSIPLEILPVLVKMRSKLKTDQMLTVGFTPDHYLAGRNSLGYNILDLERVQATVRQVVSDPEQALIDQAAAGMVDTSDCWKVD